MIDDNSLLIKFYQKLLIRSLSCRLKVLNRNLIINSQFFTSKSIFNVNFEDIIILVSNLRNLSINSSISTFYFCKRYGYSIFFQMPFFYMNCIQSLWNYSVLPIVENNSDKFSYGFRPFRSTQDLFVEIKNSFLKKRLPLWMVDFKINSSIKLYNSDWLMKNFPVEKKILRSWFGLNTFNFLNNLAYFGDGNIFFSLVNFSVNGLVL